MQRSPTSAKSPASTEANANFSGVQVSDSADRIGMVGSVLCAIHCALAPLLVSVLPALGLGFFASADLDQGFAVFATMLGVSTLAIGYRRHRAFQALALLVPGLAMILLGSFSHLHDHSLGHAVLMVVGGLLVAAAHLVNMRLTHRRLSPRKALCTASEAA